MWGNLESAIIIIHAVNCKITPKSIFLVPTLLPALKRKPHPCFFWTIALASSLGAPFALLPPSGHCQVCSYQHITEETSTPA